MGKTKFTLSTDEKKLLRPGRYRFGALCNPALIKIAKKYGVNISKAARRGILSEIREEQGQNESL